MYSIWRFFAIKIIRKYVRFLHPWKNYAQNGRSDSTPRALTLTKCLGIYLRLVLKSGLGLKAFSNLVLSHWLFRGVGRSENLGGWSVNGVSIICPPILRVN